MIERKTITELARKFDIDEYSILREYMQLLFLRDFYQIADSANVFFKGGTLIHLLLRSFRFSEDLDFTADISKAEIKNMLRSTVEKISRETAGLECELMSEDARSMVHRLKFPTDLSIRPLTVRIEMSLREKPLTRKTSVIETEFPVSPYPLVVHCDLEEVLAEKIRAILTRKQGRDLFDLWYLFSKGVKLNEKYVVNKMRFYKKEYDRSVLIKTVEEIPAGSLKDDLEKFLPRSFRKMIGELKASVIDKLNALTLESD
jgi:predicted nucleotidyltransferase component of viral defense system